MNRFVTRRELLVSVAAALVAAPTRAQTPKPPITLLGLNHVSLAVSNVQRSQEFYQRLFGMPLVHRQGSVPVLRIGSGPQFIALYNAGSAVPGIGHVCFAVEDFNPDRLMQTLAVHGVAKTVPGTAPETAWVRMRGEKAGGAREGTPELYFNDPDGLTCQLQAATYCGGAGVNGELCTMNERPASQPFPTRALNHVTVAVSDEHRSLRFYQRIFGMPVQARQGAGVLLAAGAHPDFIAVSQAAPNRKPQVDHFCVTVDDFDPDRIMKTLAGLGVKERTSSTSTSPMTSWVRWRQVNANGGGAGAPNGTPEVYFRDPDNIGGQIQDARYCGGSGLYGQVCP
ncbi:MAG TPA: VOC family protein [Vicinamibacterales bacterium]|nr:VOC family protein [Vicinamibacterales bacterium]